MLRAVVLALLLSLPAPVGAEHAPPDSSPVRVLWRAEGRCSAVVMAPHIALTAAHCLGPELAIDGRPVTGTQTGEDLARLQGNFDPPYARLSGETPDDVLLEGYGCDPKPVFILWQPVREVRAGLRIPASGGAGLELVIAGRACRGDSGGAVWAERGNLIGIITATATQAPYVERLAFATPARL